MTDQNNRKVIEDIIISLENHRRGISTANSTNDKPEWSLYTMRIDALRSLLADLEAWKDTNLRLQGENDSYKIAARVEGDRADVLKAERDRLRAHNITSAGQYGKNMAERDKEHNNLQAKIAELEKENDMLAEENEKLKAYNPTATDYTDVKRATTGLRNEIVGLQAKIAELEERNFKQEIIIKSLQGWKDVAREQLSHFNALTEDGVEKIIEEILSSAKIHPEWLGEKFVFMQRWSIVRKILGAKKAPFTETVKFSHGKELVKYLAKSIMRYVRGEK